MLTRVFMDHSLDVLGWILEGEDDKKDIPVPACVELMISEWESETLSSETVMFPTVTNACRKPQHSKQMKMSWWAPSDRGWRDGGWGGDSSRGLSTD